MEARGGEVLAEVVMEFVEEMVEMEVDGFGVHFIAFKAEVGPVGRLDEGAHGDVADGDAADGGDGLVVGAAGFAGREFEGFVVFVVDGEDGVWRCGDLGCGVGDIEDEAPHGEARRDPFSARGGVARAVVKADVDGAFLAFAAGEGEEVPPVG